MKIEIWRLKIEIIQKLKNLFIGNFSKRFSFYSMFFKSYPFIDNSKGKS